MCILFVLFVHIYIERESELYIAIAIALQWTIGNAQVMQSNGHDDVLRAVALLQLTECNLAQMNGSWSLILQKQQNITQLIFHMINCKVSFMFYLNFGRVGMRRCLFTTFDGEQVAVCFSC